MIMNKILITTDFSSNSKAGLRFAIQMASQHNYSLTFFHSYHLLRPTNGTIRFMNRLRRLNPQKSKENFARLLTRFTKA